MNWKSICTWTAHSKRLDPEILIEVLAETATAVEVDSETISSSALTSMEGGKGGSGGGVGGGGCGFGGRPVGDTVGEV